MFFYLFFPFIFLFSFFSIFYWSCKTGISPMPSSHKQKKAILNLIDENIPHLIGTLFELGSGFLTLAIPLAKRFKENEVIAYEISPVPYYLSYILFFFFISSNLKIRKKDFFSVDLKKASLIICYLYPDAMNKLKLKFNSELKIGTYIISNTFAIPGWKPLKTVIVDDLYQTKIYLYQVEK